MMRSVRTTTLSASSVVYYILTKYVAGVGWILIGALVAIGDIDHMGVPCTRIPYLYIRCAYRRRLIWEEITMVGMMLSFPPLRQGHSVACGSTLLEFGCR